jgi:hypothetical protein
MADDLTGRARFVEHKGKRIYLIDASGLDYERILVLADKVALDVRAQPPGSTLTISHVKGASMDRRMMEKLRWLVDGNRPHVKASCVTGLGPLHRFVFNTVKIVTGRDFKTFETVEQAKDYLAALP